MTAPVPSDQQPPSIRDGAIQLGQLKSNPPGRQADEVMRVVSEHFGQQWYAVKLSGWWLVVCREAGVHWGAKPGQYTRDFARALAEATGLPVVRAVVVHRTDSVQ